MTKEDWNDLEYFERAWKLGMIMKYMNNEEAYYGSGWLYIWPDGETWEQCYDDFNTEEAYQELEDSFKRHYGDEEYHGDGLYSHRGVPKSVIKDAHFWDKELGLKPIEIIK